MPQTRAALDSLVARLLRTESIAAATAAVVGIVIAISEDAEVGGFTTALSAIALGISRGIAKHGSSRER